MAHIDITLHQQSAAKLLTLLERDNFETDDTEIMKWFQELGKYAWQDNSIRTESHNKFQRVLPKLFLLLNESLLTMRWREVLHVMTSISKEVRNSDHTLLHVGLEVLRDEDDTLPEMSSVRGRLISQLKVLVNLDMKEVIVEYISQLLSQGKFDDAKDQIKNIKRHAGTVRGETNRSSHFAFLYQMYQGLVWYVEWRLAKEKLDSITANSVTEELTAEEMTQIMLQETHMRSHAQRAIHDLSGVQDQPGVWDLHVLKLVELLEFEDEVDQAEAVLQTYAEKHSDNPNAHRYLYHFYKKYCKDKKMQMQFLQNFCDAVPSDEMALELYDLYIEAGEGPASVLYLLFDLLDYQNWQHDNRPWSRLAHSLTTIADGSAGGCDEVTSCWSSRSSWWPHYHFLPDHVTRPLHNDDQHLLSSKALAACLLLGPENKYTSTVKDHIRDQSVKDWITKYQTNSQCLVQR